MMIGAHKMLMSRRRKIKSASPSMAAGDVGVADTAKNSCNDPPTQNGMKVSVGTESPLTKEVAKLCSTQLQ